MTVIPGRTAAGIGPRSLPPVPGESASPRDKGRGQGFHPGRGQIYLYTADKHARTLSSLCSSALVVVFVGRCEGDLLLHGST